MNPIYLLKPAAHIALAWGFICQAALLAAPLNETNRAVHLRYFVITTGHELLEGVYPDTHTSFITRTLRPLGAQCVGSMAVDDQMQEIQQALKFASQKASVVIVTGGLGPTEDDITRQCLSKYTGIALQEHPDLITEMTRRFKQKTEDIRPNLRRQTQVPILGSYLPNSNGTAAGLIFDSPELIVIALPGPPRELQPMVNNELVPWLAKRFQTHSVAKTLMLRFVGVGQSQIAQTIKDRVSIPPEVMMYSQFDEMRVDFTFAVPDNQSADLQILSRLEDQIRGVLGDFLYANDISSLEDIIAQKMLAQNPNLALLEVATGGQLAAAFHAKTKSKKLTVVAWSAPSLEKLNPLIHAPSDRTASQDKNDEALKRLVETALNNSNSWAILVGEKETNASGSGIKVLLRTPSKQYHSGRISVDKTGEINAARLTTQIFDFVWRKTR